MWREVALSQLSVCPGFIWPAPEGCAPEFLTIKKYSCMLCNCCISVVCVKHLCWKFDSNSLRMYCIHGWNAMLMICVTIAIVALRSFLLGCLIHLFVWCTGFIFISDCTLFDLFSMAIDIRTGVKCCEINLVAALLELEMLNVMWP